MTRMPLALGDFRHRCEIVFDRFQCGFSRVLGNVVDAREYDDSFRLQCDHVLTEAYEHLRSRLAGNTAVDVRLARKKFRTVGRGGLLRTAPSLR